MLKRLLALVIVLAPLASVGREKRENWLEVSGPHFTVFSDGGEKDARRIADQFERMRLVFHTAFPNMQVDSSAPVFVIAVKDAKTFQALEPEAYLKKGQLQLAGLFLRAPDKNYVLLRMDAGGEHPYATVYHEYTHLLLSKSEWIPLWLDEGLAEFYQNTDISEKHTVLGEASADDILWLRKNRLLPLTTLLAVDHNSPYYHEEKKGSIFYAESWALAHYLQVKDKQEGSDRLRDYMILLRKQVDPVTAATQAFGDLKQLQAALERYIEGPLFSFKLTKALPVDDALFKVKPITPTQADAVRADFLAYNQRENDSRALLSQVLQDDANNTLALETMGYLEFRAGRLDQAQKWFEQAVKLDSQSYLANYYFASIAMSHGVAGEESEREIESSLQKAIKLSPAFAAAYDRLAVFYAMRYKNLDQAHLLTLKAIQLDPGHIAFRLDAARVLQAMRRDQDAVAVLQAALKVARTSAEASEIQYQLQAVQHAEAARTEDEEIERQYREATAAAKDYEPEKTDTGAEEKEENLKGPQRSIIGTVSNVRCSPPAVIDLDVNAGGKVVTLHARNYYQVQFTALNYTAKPEFQPCTDLEGMHVRAEYVESVSAKINGLVTIELHK